MPKITHKDAHNESSLYIYFLNSFFFNYMDLYLSRKKKKVHRPYNNVYMDFSNELVALFNEYIFF